MLMVGRTGSIKWLSRLDFAVGTNESFLCGKPDRNFTKWMLRGILLHTSLRFEPARVKRYRWAFLTAFSRRTPTRARASRSQAIMLRASKGQPKSANRSTLKPVLSGSARRSPGRWGISLSPRTASTAIVSLGSSFAIRTRFSFLKIGSRDSTSLAKARSPSGSTTRTSWRLTSTGPRIEASNSSSWSTSTDQVCISSSPNAKRISWPESGSI